jgi:NADPH:quinone reductase
MKAVQVTDLSGPEGVKVAEVEQPQATDGNLLIDVHAAGISYPELLLSRGLYQIKPDPPFTLGSEVSGKVREAPEGSGFEPGDCVAAFTMGAFAEVAAAPPHMTFKLPDQLDFCEGAGLVLNYHTAHFCLMRRASLQEGESLLVHGAGGGVGTAAVQVGKAAGAHVVGVVSSDEKEQVARKSGADDIARIASEASGARRAERGEGDDWKEAAKEFARDEGYDVVFDPVGGERFNDSVRLLRTEGRIVVVGFTEGSIPEIAVNRLLFRCASVVGAAWGHYAFTRPDYLKEVGEDLERMVREGHVKPIVGKRYAFDQVPQALRDIDERRAVGKLVLDVNHQEG